MPAQPDMLTAVEAGLTDFEVTFMFGVLAPADTPVTVVAKLNATFKIILAQQDVRDALAA